MKLTSKAIVAWIGLIGFAMMPEPSQAQVGVGTGGFNYNYYGAGGPRYGLSYGRYGFGYGLNNGFDNAGYPRAFHNRNPYRYGYGVSNNPYTSYGLNPYGYGRYNDLDRNDDWYYDFYDRDYGVSYGQDLPDYSPYDYGYSDYFDGDSDALID
ncbi:hypothetical protein [Thalassoroseus pseudoceratinae]|uniref:hypothetical protein n=1 Tax=Thalassoroseus pseudoceratinae TaxID=2713176 RepID=UPI001421FE9A|nr:hypothetical protein [Thalassoroseus pseudoceratinae]